MLARLHSLDRRHMRYSDPKAAHQGNRHEWNPAIDEDCSGLYYGWWVCVGAQPRSSLTLVWTDSPGNVTIPTYDPFTPPIFATINSSFSATPTQSGLASDCNAFYSAAPVSRFPQCRKIAAICADNCAHAGRYLHEGSRAVQLYLERGIF